MGLMVERIALTVSLIAFLSACVGMALRLDRSLFSFRVQMSLRTMLILAAILPPMLAGGLKLWEVVERNGRRRARQLDLSQFPSRQAVYVPARPPSDFRPSPSRSDPGRFPDLIRDARTPKAYRPADWSQD
jgi:hypothetical protein